MLVMRSLLTLGGGGQREGKQARELPLPAPDPRGRRARRAGLRAPRPGPAPGTCRAPPRGPPDRDEVREKGRSVPLASFCLGSGGAALQLGALARAPVTSAACRHHQEKPLAFSWQSILFRKGQLCSSSTVPALEGSVRLGLGQTAQV